MGIYNDSGVLVVRFDYDAWGNVIAETDAGGNALNSTAQEYAGICPFRYRGYYFDSDTGLYYLGSRYYNSSVIRFINVDSSFVGGYTLTGWNMFAYCINNPARYFDPDGKDAVVLCNTEGYGHMGALIQDAEGNWWHFFWGTTGGLSSSQYLSGADPFTWCIQYDGEIELEEINAKGGYTYGYQEMLYLVGDFSASVEEAKHPGGRYNLINRHCGHVTLQILAVSDTVYQDMLIAATRAITPKRMLERLRNNMPNLNYQWLGGGPAMHIVGHFCAVV